MLQTLIQTVIAVLILQLTGLPLALAQTKKVPAKTPGKTTVKKPVVPASVLQEAKALQDASMLASLNGFNAGTNEILAKKIHEFLKDPKNASIRSTPIGHELLSAESKMVTMMALKARLQKCATRANDKRGLGKRILSIAGGLTPDRKKQDDDPLCVMGAQSFKSLTDVVKLYDAMSNESNWIYDSNPSTAGEKKKQLNRLGTNLDFERKLYLQSMKNALKTHLDLNYRYDTTGPIEYRAGYVMYSVDELCPSMKHGGQFLTNPCEDSTRAELHKYGLQYLNGLIASKAKQWTKAEVQTDLNGRLERLNKKMKDIPTPLYGITSMGQLTGFRPKSQVAEDYRTKQTQAFETALWRETSSGPGLLLHTDVMKDAVDPNVERDPKGHYKLYGSVKSTSTVDQAIKQAKGNIKSQTRELNTDHKATQGFRMKSSNEHRISASTAESHNEYVQEKLNKLVRTNPAAVAQLLVDEPEYVGVVCRTIAAINEEDADNESSQKAWMWGGVIVGGLLAATGIGAFFGASIIAGAGVVSTVGLLGLGLIETGKATYDSSTAYTEYQSYRNAFLAGNGDYQTVKEAEAAYDRYEDAEFNAMLSLGLTMVDLAFLKSSLKTVKTGKNAMDANVEMTERTLAIKRATNTLDLLATDPVFAQRFRLARAGMTEEEIGGFLAFLSNLDDAKRAEFILKMQAMDEKALRQYMRLHSGVKQPVPKTAKPKPKDDGNTAFKDNGMPENPKDGITTPYTLETTIQHNVENEFFSRGILYDKVEKELILENATTPLRLKSKKFVTIESYASNSKISEAWLLDGNGKRIGKIPCKKVGTECVLSTNGSPKFEVPFDTKFPVEIVKEDGTIVKWHPKGSDPIAPATGLRYELLPPKVFARRGFAGGHTLETWNEVTKTYGDVIEVTAVESKVFTLPGMDTPLELSKVRFKYGNQKTTPKTLFKTDEDFLKSTKYIEEKFMGEIKKAPLEQESFKFPLTVKNADGSTSEVYVVFGRDAPSNGTAGRIHTWYFTWDPPKGTP